MAERSWDPRCRGLNLLAGPEIDRRLWNAGVLISDDLDEAGYADRLRPATLQKALAGYSRWMGYLNLTGQLDALEHPADRVTPARIRGYVKLMRELGNRDQTLISRLADLRCTLRIMAPERNFRWLSSPKGKSLRSSLPMRKRTFMVPHSRTLFQFGLRLMNEAVPIKARYKRGIQYRDGLMIALLAARAPRAGSLSRLQLGRSLMTDGERTRILFEELDMKTGRPLEYLLPRDMQDHLEHYLAVERIGLLKGGSHDWLWVKRNGQPLRLGGILAAVRKRTEMEFPQGFGTHRFRHALGTTAPMMDPGNPGVAAAILGISGAVHEAHYIRAGQTEAADRLAETIRLARAETESLARRAYRSGRDRPSDDT